MFGTMFKRGLFGAAACTALMGASALAQEVAAEPEANEVEQVVVTAQLREQDPVDVPIALTAYDGGFLERIGVDEFEELSLFVPGFEVQNQSPNNPGFVIRGITSDSGEATVEPRVSVFQDGVSIAKSRGSYVELFDIERVEVARGPQSTLYGRGALIGAVNIIQRKADDEEFEWYGRARVGNYGLGMVEGAVNIPFGDDIGGLRLAGRLKHRDGYVENLLAGEDFNSTDTAAVRAALNVEIGERVEADIIVNYQRDEPSGTSFKSRAFNPTNPDTGEVIGNTSPYSGAALSSFSDDRFEEGRELGLEREVYGVTALVEVELADTLTLNSISAFRRFDSLEIFDADGFSLPLFTFGEDAQGEQWSQELRLNWDAGGPVSGFVGVNLFHEEGRQRVPLRFDERLVLSLLTRQIAAPGTNTPLPLAAYGVSARNAALLGALGVPAPFRTGIAANLKPSHIETFANSAETTAFDVYGDVTWAATERLEFAAGLRFTRDDKTSGIASSTSGGGSVLGVVLALPRIPAAQQLAVLTALATPGAAGRPNFGLFAQPTGGNGELQEQSLEDDGFTWRLTGRYALTEDANLYATYARGRRPAVLSAGAPAAPGGPGRFTEVDAEVVDSFELGAKARLMGDRLALDGAAFSYSYENFQTTVQENAQLVVRNAGEARSYGFEGQAQWALADAVDLFGTYAYNHSRFEAGLFEGNRFRLSPDHSASLGAAIRFAGMGGEFELAPTFTWQSEIVFDDDNDIPALQSDNIIPDLAQDEVQEGYGLINLRLAYAPSGANWRLEAFVDNVLEEEYIKDAGNTGDTFGIPTFISGEPRFFGVSFTIRSGS